MKEERGSDDGKISERISEGISERILQVFGSGKEIVMSFKIIETNPLFKAEIEYIDRVGAITIQNDELDLETNIKIEFTIKLI